jgi:DNA modification methylase
MSVTVHHGDCLDVLRGMAEASVDSVVTDPPYGLEFMGREWDAPWQLGGKSKLFGDRERATPGGWGGTRNANCRACGGRARGAKVCRCERPEWDEAPEATRVRQMRAFQDWCEAWAREVYRVMKPGAHLVAFGGTRTYHRMVCAIEDAGFEIRDQLAWLYGSGFPKSHDIGKAIDRAAGAEREVVGAHPYAARKPNGTWTGEVYGDEPGHANGPKLTAPATPEAARWSGWGTALKPAHEPIVLARKLLACPTVAAQVLATGTGALNVDATRVPTEESTARTVCGGGTNTEQWRTGRGHLTTGGAAGRWPANLVHSGDETVLAAFAAFGERQSRPGTTKMRGESQHCYGKATITDGPRHDDTGSAARFFPALGFGEDELRFHYSAKASKAERAGSSHPTVKPLALLKWLCRLVTPPGGVVLDCFAGTGVTGEAALLEGFSAVLVEREAEYVADIRRRLGRASGADTPLLSETAA